MEEFFDEMVPPYAILSHRWSGEEVSLQEWHRVEALEDKIFSTTREPAFGRPRHPNDYLHDSLEEIRQICHGERHNHIKKRVF